MPLRTICWLLLAIVGGSTIGFKLALPGSDSAPVAASAETAAGGPAPPFTFAPPGRRRVVHSLGLDTGGQSSPGLQQVSRSQGRSFGRSDTSTPTGGGPAVGFDSPYVSDLRFLALPGIPTTPATTTPPEATTTTTTLAAPVGPPPAIENVHPTALTPFSETIAWRTSVPASSRIAYGLDAPVIWTGHTVASTEHQATLTEGRRPRPQWRGLRHRRECEPERDHRLHTITARSGSFTDSFAPLEVRIYVASPFQG